MQHLALAHRYVPWRAQHVAYEILRAEVGGLARIFPHVAERVSYADLHALAGTNNCGFTTRFPHYAYFPLDKVKHVVFGRCFAHITYKFMCAYLLFSYVCTLVHFTFASPSFFSMCSQTPSAAAVEEELSACAMPNLLCRRPMLKRSVKRVGPQEKT